jgi:hypothetical protein
MAGVRAAGQRQADLEVASRAAAVLRKWIRRNRELAADILVFLPGALGAVLVLAIANWRSPLHFPFLFYQLALPILCGYASMMILRRRIRSLGAEDLFATLDQARWQMALALLGYIIASIIFVLLFVAFGYLFY